MKKTAVILIILALVLAFSACADNKPQTTAGTDVSTPETLSSSTAQNTGAASDLPLEQTSEPTSARAECTAFVTIIDQNGKLVLPQQPITVGDLDGDGKLTIDEAFVCAHETAYEGGRNGYESGTSDWGLSIFKLWGSTGASSFSYYLNGNMAMGLTEEVKEGDYLDAYVYTDTCNTFSRFDRRTVSAAKDEEFTLTLFKYGFDENWQTVLYTADEGIRILVNGEESQHTVGADGGVTLSFSEPGVYTVSATSASVEGVFLVPPVCIVTVNG